MPNVSVPFENQLPSTPPEGRGQGAKVSNLDSQRALRILAKSVYKELKVGGYNRTEMVNFATELLGLVTVDFRDENEEQPLQNAE